MADTNFGAATFDEPEESLVPQVDDGGEMDASESMNEMTVPDGRVQVDAIDNEEFVEQTDDSDETEEPDAGDAGDETPQAEEEEAPKASNDALVDFLREMEAKTPGFTASIMQPQAQAPAQNATEVAQQQTQASLPEPTVETLDAMVKPLADHFSSITGEDSTPAVREFAKSMFKQVGGVFKEQIAQRDQQISELNGVVQRVTGYIEKQEIGRVFDGMQADFPELKNQHTRDQVESRMRSLGKSEDYRTINELAMAAAGAEILVQRLQKSKKPAAKAVVAAKTKSGRGGTIPSQPSGANRGVKLTPDQIRKQAALVAVKGGSQSDILRVVKSASKR